MEVALSRARVMKRREGERGAVVAANSTQHKLVVEQDGVSAHPHLLIACNLVLTVGGKVLVYNGRSPWC